MEERLIGNFHSAFFFFEKIMDNCENSNLVLKLWLNILIIKSLLFIFYLFIYISMKKLSLFGLAWLAGLLAFVATPIYAQEENAVLDDENLVPVSEGLDAEVLAVEVDEPTAELNYVEDEDLVISETADEDIVEGTLDLNNIENFNDIFENEEVRAALDEAGLTNEEAAWIFGWVAGLFAGFGIAGIVVAIVWCILVIVAMWRIFTKAWEKWWKSLIPIYNLYIMYKIVGMKNWFWYTLIVAFVCGLIAGFLWEESAAAGYVTMAGSLFSGIVAIVATFKLPRKFGWGVFTSILYVLFTGICILILGFGNFKYQGKEESTVVEA